MNTLATLIECIVKSPTNETLKLVTADAITEETGNYEQALITVNEIADAALQKRADCQEKYLLRGTTKKTILNQLAEANGRRRERTLTYEDVVNCIKQARKDGWHAVGGRVTNAYKYPAWQTACLTVIGFNKKVVVRIGVISARKSSSLTNPFCGLSITASAQQFRNWADSLMERMSA